jgi:hypothetical protein
VNSRILVYLAEIASVLHRTSQQKAHALKAQIRDLVDTGLVEITGLENIRMQYEHYVPKIVLKHGVELVGWTANRFANPSQLSSALDGLFTLRDALLEKRCAWKRLTSDELQQRQKEYDAAVTNGTVNPRTQKTRKDAGKPRKKAGGGEKSAELVESDNESTIHRDGGGRQDGDEENRGHQEEAADVNQECK